MAVAVERARRAGTRTVVDVERGAARHRPAAARDGRRDRRRRLSGELHRQGGARRGAGGAAGRLGRGGRLRDPGRGGEPRPGDGPRGQDPGVRRRRRRHHRAPATCSGRGSSPGGWPVAPGRNWKTVLRWANAMAALNCRGLGAQAGPTVRGSARADVRAACNLRPGPAVQGIEAACHAGRFLPRGLDAVAGDDRPGASPARRRRHCRRRGPGRGGAGRVGPRPSTCWSPGTAAASTRCATAS